MFKKIVVSSVVVAALAVSSGSAASSGSAKPAAAKRTPARHHVAKPRSNARLQTKSDERYGQLYRLGNSGPWMN
jgi:hypothetical protein